jgi:hypothetical protein
MSCDKIQLLLSKYADNEASQVERDAVRAHVAGCANCARKLAEFETVHALFASAPTLPPEPQLRVGLFREINLMKEEERRRSQRARESRPWFLPFPAFTLSRRSGPARLLSVFNPVVVAVVAVFALFGFVALYNRPFNSPNTPVVSQTNYPPAVPTISASSAVAIVSDSVDVIPASTSGVPGTLLPSSDVSATVPPSDASDGFLLLSDPTPVLEDFASAVTPVHMVRDATYGYSIHYPANWWTQVAGGVRYFRPWKGGDTPPYWVELHVVSNNSGYAAATFNSQKLNGKGTVIPGSSNSTARLRNTSGDSNNSYDDLYSFDRAYVYQLRLSVPKEVNQPGFNKRWEDAEAIFSGMSGRTRLGQEHPQSPGYGTALFLDGDNLYAVSMRGQAQMVARGTSIHGVIRQFTLAPDAGRVAFTSAKERADLWSRYLYVSSLDGESPDSPNLLWSSAVEIRDIAWYSERVLLVIARTTQGSGIYRVSLPAQGQEFDPSTMIQRITDLNDTVKSARSLAVSPDRQLITFLAPIGESAGTNIYAVRPDGRDLRLLLSHEVPVAPSDRGTRLLRPEEQAIKSYAWVDGRLELDGYRYKLLYTCGNALFPALFRGGFLYAAPSDTHMPVLDTGQLANLGVSDPTKLQIVHVAYSTDGRVAMTGYYNDFEGRADKLAGLWTADVVEGQLVNIESQPIPTAPHGIADLQWSPDNASLVYRETMPQAPDSFSDRYDGISPFIIVKHDLREGARTNLYIRQVR